MVWELYGCHCLSARSLSERTRASLAMVERSLGVCQEDNLPHFISCA